MKAVLLLEDGSFYTGESFGAIGEAFGDVVFNTSMTGYQEILTDPSYNGELIVMTYPLIGNYGFNNIDNESIKAFAGGMIVKEICEYPSNWRMDCSFSEFFAKHGVVGIKGIDTRSLTRHIRNFGSMASIISTETGNVEKLMKKLKAKKEEKRNFVLEATTKVVEHVKGEGKTVVVVDFGIKRNIIRELSNRGLNLHIVPAFSTYEEIMELNPDGILLSNGPGDPRNLECVVEVVKKLIKVKPLLGICLGHQLLGLALGGKIYKLKFGHHGANHGVMDVVSKKCYITSQNHNYALDYTTGGSFNEDVEITHININDKTVEGIKHKTLPVRSYQYHPEASPGPKDSTHIFDEFIKVLG